MKKILAVIIMSVLFLGMTNSISADAKTLIVLSDYRRYCTLHSDNTSKCTWLCLAGCFNMETGECFDAYWEKFNWHWPNYYSAKGTGYNRQYAHGTYSREICLLGKIIADLDGGLGSSTSTIYCWYNPKN